MMRRCALRGHRPRELRSALDIGWETHLRLTFGTGRLADVSARHPWWVIGIWVALLVAAVFSFPSLTSALTASEMHFLNNPESAQGQTLIDESASATSGTSGDVETLLVHSDTYTVDDAAFQQIVQDSTAAVAAQAGAVQSAYNYYQVSMLDPASAADMVSTDRHTTFIYVTLTPGDADFGAYLSTAEGLSRDGFTVTTIGQASIGEELSSAATSDLRSAETVGLPITMLVLVHRVRCLRGGRHLADPGARYHRCHHRRGHRHRELWCRSRSSS